MHTTVQPNTYIALRLPNETLRVLEIVPNTTISLGKYGSFPSNLLLGRPYHLTFELLDKSTGQAQPELRIVPASELNAEALTTELDQSVNGPDYIEDGTPDRTPAPADGVEYDIVAEDGSVVMRSNRNIIDDPSRQKLTQLDIEALKAAGVTGQELITRLMEAHSGLEQKTAFSLAKYTLRKTKKFGRRFTVLPLDVPILGKWLLEGRDPSKIMEMREELLALLVSWSNAHWSANNAVCQDDDGVQIGGGRWLVVDDTGGLVVAALAEKMGILYPRTEEDSDEDVSDAEESAGPTPPPLNSHEEESSEATPDAPVDSQIAHDTHAPPPPSSTNSITLIHPATQPNLSLLTYFSFPYTAPPPSHPLTTHLHTLSLLQLLSPQDDSTYNNPPPTMTAAELKTLKSGKRGTYFRKRRRWERIRRTVDSTRAGGFDGLVVATSMDPVGVLRLCVPLLRGGASVVVYSPMTEGLLELVDLYSTARRAAFVRRKLERLEKDSSDVPTEEANDPNLDPSARNTQINGEVGASGPTPPSPLDSLPPPDEDFPVDPTLLINASLQIVRGRQWQVLPGRTHPKMIGRGGAAGCLFTATRVIPIARGPGGEGGVVGRGKFKRTKKRQEEPPDNSVKSKKARLDVDARQGQVLDIIIDEDMQIDG